MPIAENIKPVSFSFNNSDRCQSRCITCNGWKTPASVQENELTCDEWKRILFQMHEWMGNYTFIFSGGEPFIRDDVLELASYAKSLGDTVNVVTNALALPGRESEIMNSDFSTIIFSINSVKNPLIHIESRGREDSFKRTMDVFQNMNYINKYKNPEKPKSFVISTVVMPSNLDEIKPMAEFCKTEGIGVSFQLLDNGDAFTPPDGTENHTAIVDEDVHKKALDAVDLMIELKKQGYPVYNGFPQLAAFKVLMTNPDQIQEIQCNVGNNNFSIDPYGNVRICFCMEPIGSLKEHTPQELWYGEKAEEVREKIKNCTKKCRLLNCNFKE